MSAVACPGCGEGSLRVIAEVPRVPVFCNVAYADAKSARAAQRGDIVLGFCDVCSLIHNIAFDATLLQYDQRYENSLHFSPRFAEYADALAQRLLGRHGDSGVDVIEIGCGKGEFLRLLTADGANRCVGFDTSYDPSMHADEAVTGMTIRREFFVPDRHPERADLLLTRHVLEHIARPVEFVREISRGLRDSDGAEFFCEVPNGLWTLEDLGIWDLIYEHCTYFTAPALTRVLTDAGLVVRAAYTEFGNQFLCAEATRDASEPLQLTPSVADIGGMADRFGAHLEAKVAHWNQTLDELLTRGQTTVIWGAGSKGATFLNILSRGHEIQGVIDINPRKRGCHVAGTGQQVQGPEWLRDHPVDVVLIMNPAYETEIQAQLSALGCDARTLTV